MNIRAIQKPWFVPQLLRHCPSQLETDVLWRAVWRQYNQHHVWRRCDVTWCLMTAVSTYPGVWRLWSVIERHNVILTWPRMLNADIRKAEDDFLGSWENNQTISRTLKQLCVGVRVRLCACAWARVVCACVHVYMQYELIEFRNLLHVHINCLSII
jgi:hypothetical protein